MVNLDGRHLSINDVAKVAYEYEKVSVSEKVYQKLAKVRKVLENYVENQIPIYGVTTSFGEMVLHLIPSKYERLLQENLIRSHACQVGDEYSVSEVRAIMLARANCLAYGNSGVKPETLKLLVSFLNLGIHPVVRELGTVGASGDLGPLSQIALALIGEGYVRISGYSKIIEASEALKMFGLKPLKLGYKEGLALINGTSASTGVACLNIYHAKKLLANAIKIASISLEALNASTKAFDVKGQKGHHGQIFVASKISRILSSSKLVRPQSLIMNKLKSVYSNEKVIDVSEYIQDAYSLRCIPQVMGPVVDTLQWASAIVTQELNSPNDNPLFFEDGDVFHGGNYHGQYIANAMDYLAIALTQLGNLSERRLNRLIDKNLNKGLPEFLTPKEVGLNLGFEGLQYVAVEACAENRVLSTPASIQNIPSNEENQDIVPMADWASRKCRKIIQNLAIILACEAIAACQAVEFRGVDKMSKTTRAFYKQIRKLVPKLEDDRPLGEDIARVAHYILS